MARILVGGEQVDAASGETYEVRNPATGEVVDVVPKGGVEDVRQAVDAAAPSITVRTAEGNTVSFRVQDGKNLENVRPGDRFVIAYAEAVAIQVSAPQAK